MSSEFAMHRTRMIDYAAISGELESILASKPRPSTAGSWSAH